jgi:TM2 domain-containing membrane protein YozV
MNILNEVVKGASQQFGREFGRAGANAILKGKNYYAVKSVSDYSGRIKPSDSQIVRSIKEILKLKFVTTNKANISRLIDLTDIATGALSFNGVSTLNEIQDIKNLIEQYNDKFEHGSVLVDDDFNDKSVEFLKEKREAFVNSLNQFNTDIKDFVKKTLELAIKKKKIKKTAILLSCPFLIIGCFGFHKFYLRQAGYGILYILLSLVGISGLLALINFFQLILMSQDKFDVKYNPEFSYYSQFKFD